MMKTLIGWFVLQRAFARADFGPLSCNSGGFSPCIDFTSQFGAGTTFSSIVTIPCGQCFRMNHASGTVLNFLSGIDIQGKLLFDEPSDPNFSLEIKTPGIVVQGEMAVFATKAVDGSPNWKFTMTGDSEFAFTPAANNAGECGGSSCNGGKRSITVAGGKVDCK